MLTFKFDMALYGLWIGLSSWAPLSASLSYSARTGSLRWIVYTRGQQVRTVEMCEVPRIVEREDV